MPSGLFFRGTDAEARALQFGIPTIEAKAWNQVRADLKRAQARTGSNVRLQWSPEGVTAAAYGEQAAAHPWQLSPFWEPAADASQRGRWRANVRPGFCNGRDVTVEEVRDLLEETVPLTDELPPALTFSGFRDPAAPAGIAAGLDGEIHQAAGEGYPEFFAALGVKPAAIAGTIGQTMSDPTRTRQIRAADVVLITPRLATRQDSEARDPFSTGQTVEISTVFLNDALRQAPSAHRLETFARWSPPTSPSDAERLLGVAVDSQTDELRLSCVYFVSEPGAGEDAEPDETWSAWPVHFVFWNLAHASRVPIPEAPPEPLTFFSGLVGGAFDGLFNALLANVNDTTAQILLFLSSTDFRGIYWSPGGIGTDSDTRPAPAAAKTGSTAPSLDPRENRAAREAEAAIARASVPPLNPPFPFRKTRFNPSHFALEDEPAR